MTKLENKLIKLGYIAVKGLNGVYKKSFAYTYISFHIKGNTIDYKYSGVQSNNLNKFHYESQINDLNSTFIIYVNDLIILENDMEEIKKYEEKD